MWSNLIYIYFVANAKVGGQPGRQPESNAAMETWVARVSSSTKAEEHGGIVLQCGEQSQWNDAAVKMHQLVELWYQYVLLALSPSCRQDHIL